MPILDCAFGQSNSLVWGGGRLNGQLAVMYSAPDV